MKDYQLMVWILIAVLAYLVIRNSGVLAANPIPGEGTNLLKAGLMPFSLLFNKYTKEV